jgi:hypothetical protein
MNEKPGKPFKGVGKLVAILLLLAALYVPSVGPAYVLTVRGIVSEPTIRFVYRPLFFAAERSETAQRWLVWYWTLWLPLAS